MSNLNITQFVKFSINKSQLSFSMRNQNRYVNCLSREFFENSLPKIAKNPFLPICKRSKFRASARSYVKAYFDSLLRPSHTNSFRVLKLYDLRQTNFRFTSIEHHVLYISTLVQQKYLFSCWIYFFRHSSFRNKIFQLGLNCGTSISSCNRFVGNFGGIKVLIMIDIGATS